MLLLPNRIRRRPWSVRATSLRGPDSWDSMSVSAHFSKEGGAHRAHVPFHRGYRVQMSTDQNGCCTGRVGMRTGCACVVATSRLRRQAGQAELGMRDAAVLLWKVAAWLLRPHIVEILFRRTPRVHQTEQHQWPKSLSRPAYKQARSTLMCLRTSAIRTSSHLPRQQGHCNSPSS